MDLKLLTQQHLEFLSLKEGCTGSSESTLVKMPHCWKSHVTAQSCSINSSFLAATFEVCWSDNFCKKQFGSRSENVGTDLDPNHLTLYGVPEIIFWKGWFWSRRALRPWVACTRMTVYKGIWKHSSSQCPAMNFDRSVYMDYVEKISKM